MGDNDFTAGDPWGLPIEDSEETEIEVARPDEEPQVPHHEAGSGPDDEPEPGDDYVLEPGLEDGVDLGEDGDGGDAWSPTSEDVQPLAIGDHADQEEVHEVEEAISEGADEEYTFKAPSRTPLSQMIAAAQSVVNSVQGDASEDIDEDIDEADEKPFREDEPPFADEAPTEGAPLADPIEAESIVPPAYSTVDQAAVDDDLPEEPPSWMVIETEAEGETSDAFPTDDAMASEDGDLAGGDQTLPPLDIEASIAELATPETSQAPFAEDRFEMPGEEEPVSEDDFGVVDLDSSPGVYSELQDLAGQDEQAEAMLQEAAIAFGRSDPTTIEPIEEITEDLNEEPALEDIDSYADALATQLGTEDTEPTEEITEDLNEEPALEDIDSYADALAAQLGAEDTEPIEEVPVDLLGMEQAGLVDADAPPYLSEDELGAALTGITDTTLEDDLAEAVEMVELPEPDEPVKAAWWEAETSASDDLPEAVEAVELTEQDEAVKAAWWEAETPASDDLAETVETVELTEPDEPVAAGLWRTEDTTPIEEVPADLFEVEQAGLVDADAPPYLSEDELGAALAGITDTTPQDDLAEAVETVELTEPDEPVKAAWWEAETPASDDLAEPDEVVESVEINEPVEPVAAGWWSADGPVGDELVEPTDSEATIDAVGAVGWDAPADDQDASMEIDDTGATTHEAAAVIDSSVEWGARYREAHQGWVEDDEGRSTWRPIVTSGESVAGWDIDIYLGLVSGDISIDPVTTEAVASEVAAAREGAVRRMLDEGLARGAHAIVGVTFSLQEVAGTVLVGASGVAVTLRTPA